MYTTLLTLPLTLLTLAPTTFAQPTLNTRQSTTFPNPEPCTGNCSFIHDPSVVRHADGTYYRLSTNGNIAIASAPDLTGPWTYQGAMLPEGSSIDFAPEQEMWAPDTTLINDQYHTFYAVSKIGLQNSSIGLATSPSLEPGSWTDHGAVDIPLDPRWNLIDPNLYHTGADAPYYFMFGSSWDAIFQTQLTPSSNFLSQGGDGPVQKAYNSTQSVTEGAFQFLYPTPQGTYTYLFFSNGACCNKAFNGGEGDLAPPGEEYKVLVCRSENETGPFVDDQGRDCATEDGGTLVLGSHGDVYAPGGQEVMVDEGEGGSGRVVMYYHYVDTTIGYLYEQFQFGFNYLDFSSGWPVVTT